MALRSLGSVARGGMRAWSSSSSPGIQGALGSAARSDSDALHSLGNACTHDGPVATAALSAFAGSCGLLHTRAEPARRGAPGFAEPELARRGAPGFAEPELEPARRGALRFPEPEPGRRGALRFASLRELVAERADEAFATLTAAFFSALFGILHLMKDEDESDEARKNKNTHTAYLLSHQLIKEMEREKASYNKTMPDEKAVVQEYMEDDQALKARFQEWMKKYGKTYKDEVEKARRYKIFKSVARFADAANIEAAKAGHSACYGVNKFSDWNAEEMARLSSYRTRRDGGYFKMVMSYLAPQWIWYQVADNKADISSTVVSASCDDYVRVMYSSCMKEFEYGRG